MRIDLPAICVTYITFSHNGKITRDTRSLSIVDATKEEITNLIKELFKDELDRGNTPARQFTKLTVKICNSEKKTKDEFSFRLYRTDVNAIEKIIKHLNV